MRTNFKKRNRILIIVVPIIVAILVILSVRYIINKQTIKVNTLEYFIQGTIIEPKDLSWGSEPSEAIKFFGKMDESYERYLSYKQRLIPIRQMYFKDLNLNTESIGIMYTTEGKLKEVVYVFRFDTVEESVKEYQQLVNYLSDVFHDVLEYKEAGYAVYEKNEKGELILNPQYLWEDEEGNTLRINNGSYSEDFPTVSISASSKTD